MEVFLSTAIEFGVIFLFGCVGEILTEKSGHLNLGIPGIMCMGARRKIRAACSRYSSPFCSP